MADSTTSIIEGTVKFRDGKKWKSRWCVMRKLSPVADCVHLQLYKDFKERSRSGQTKASLSLQQFLGFESGFTLDKESNTLAILCEDVAPVLAFDTREMLMQWRVKVQHNLGSSREYPAVLVTAPASCSLRGGAVRLHVCGARLALCGGRPPELWALWDVRLLRRYGMVDKRFCVEGGSRCGKGEGLFVFATDKGRELADSLSYSQDASQSRLSMASRSGSALDKRFSDSSSCAGDCYRSASPSWGGPASQTMHCLSDLDSGLEGDAFARRPMSLPRCTSCVGKISSHLQRSSTMSVAGGLMSPVWTMDNILEKRSDGDRASMYSRSSGSASDYSGPRLDKSFDSKRSSPVTCCTPTIPAKTGSACQCWQQKPCCCRKKAYSGPYENYDVPKAPMPLIQEHPIDGNADPLSNYDTPKKLKCMLNGQLCHCMHPANPNNEDNQTLEVVIVHENNNCDTSDKETILENHSNYVNVEPVANGHEMLQPHDFGNYANIDLNVTLEKFESSLQILRNAGFSQEEIDAPDEDALTATNAKHPSTECCTEHLNYMHMDPLENSSSSNSKNCSDSVSRISHVSDPTQSSETDNTISTRRSSSADFTKKHEDDYGFNPNMCYTPTVLRKAKKRVNDNALRISAEMFEAKDKFKIPESKTENSLVARFRDSVKIRRSSSVPSKTDKNRDSSSSNDSGVSTGSLKHHRCDFTEFEMPITSSKSSKKHMKCNKQANRSLTPIHMPDLRSMSSEPLKNLTFHFEEVATLTKSNSCDMDTLTRRKKRNCDGDASSRHSQATAASDTSDYMESLSVSSLSCCDVPCERHASRPRSAKEYASIDRSALQ